MRRVGIGFCAQPYTIGEILSAAKSAEQSGFESFWITEDIWTGRDAFSILSAVALSTEQIQVGTAVIGLYTRHPLIVAQTFNALSEVAPNRLNLGIGAGTTWKKHLTGQVNMTSPLSAMREAVLAIRGLLAGDTIIWRGEEITFTLTRPCFEDAIPNIGHHVPIYIGAVGPRMTELAGEIGDGFLLEMEARKDQIPERLGQITQGASLSNRKIDSIDVAKLIIISVSINGKINRNALGYAAKHISNFDEATIQKLDLDPEQVRQVREAYQMGDCETAYRRLSPELASSIICCGNQDECLTYIEGITVVGVKLPIILSFGGQLEPIIELGSEYASTG